MTEGEDECSACWGMVLTFMTVIVFPLMVLPLIMLSLGDCAIDDDDDDDDDTDITKKQCW